jgi:hypothetical protein
MATEFIRSLGEGVIHMTYSTPGERSSLIAGLRDLADFLEARPEVPTPRWIDMLVFPPHGTDDEVKAEIKRIAALIDVSVNDQTADDGHYTAARKFRPVQYEAVAILAGWQARRAARMSYAENIIVPDDTGKEA